MLYAFSASKYKNGLSSYQLNLAIYTVIFGVYLICRFSLYFKAKKNLTLANTLRTIGIPIILCISFALIKIPFSEKHFEKNVILVDEDVASADATVISSIAQPAYNDGIWIGTALGYNDNITVSVTISNGKIIDISIKEGYDDEPYYNLAKQKIPQAIIDAQSPEIDTVSGATFSSKGIIHAVEAALENAQK